MGLRRWLAVVAVVAACAGDDDSGGGGGGGGGDGTGTVSGTVGGRTITVVDAISSNYDYTVTNTLHYGVVLLGEPAELCALAGADIPSEAAVLSLTATVLSTSDGNYVGTLPTAGTYTVNGQIGNVAFGELNASASCDVSGVMAQSGTVTLTTAANGVYAGSFDLVFETGDHVTGTFSPAACPALTQPELSCIP